MTGSVPRPGVAVTAARALAWRTRRHLLRGPAAGRAIDVARRLCGVHAQVMSSAELAISIRAKDLTPAKVRAALRRRSLVKTWAFRGTIHLLAADELPMWVAALGTWNPYYRPAWLKWFGVTREEFDTMIDGIGRALDGRNLTREQLAREVARATKRPHLEEVVKSSWGSALKPAMRRGLLVFGPSDGRNVTFVRPDQWVKGWHRPDPDASMDEAVRRYLDTYGPATHWDFARWFGIQDGTSRKRFAKLADELVEVHVDGEPAWMTAAGARAIARQREAPLVRLLPGFDPYVVGSLRSLETLLPHGTRARVSRQSGWISPVLLIDGRIAGTWSHEVAERRLVVTIEPFARLPKRVKDAAERDAARYGNLLAAAPEVTWA